MAAPLLLKEKDEKELDANTVMANEPPLLDFTIHSLNLKASHSGKRYYFHSEILYYVYPEILTAYCTFLI